MAGKDGWEWTDVPTWVLVIGGVLAIGLFIVVMWVIDRAAHG